MSIVSVVETIGIEGEGIFSLKVTDAQISLEKLTDVRSSP
jgi:hypothetical protein